MKQHIPNFFTLLNLTLGTVALLALLYGRLSLAVGLVVAAASADLLDGALARWLRVQSPLGHQLDALADVVSFGAVPGVALYGLLGAAWQQGIWPDHLVVPALPGLLVAPCAALRLAKFTLDGRQSISFLGLPTPASALLVLGLLVWYQRWPQALWLQAPALYTVVALLAVLMLSEVPMFSLKIKSWGWQGNEIKIIFVAISLAGVVLGGLLAIAPAVLLYITLSLGSFFLTRKSRP